MFEAPGRLIIRTRLGEVARMSSIICRLISLRNVFIMNHFIRYFTFLPSISTKIAPAALRMCGVKVGKNVFIGQGVYFDAHPEAIEIGNDVLIAPNVQILTHKRDLSVYKRGMKYYEVPHVVKPVKLCDNCLIGLGALLMPGVTVGEGGFVAAGAVVAKDVPPYTVVAGVPASPIREYLEDGTSRRLVS